MSALPPRASKLQHRWEMTLRGKNGLRIAAQSIVILVGTLRRRALAMVRMDHEI